MLGLYIYVILSGHQIQNVTYLHIATYSRGITWCASMDKPGICFAILHWYMSQAAQADNAPGMSRMIR